MTVVNRLGMDTYRTWFAMTWVAAFCRATAWGMLASALACACLLTGAQSSATLVSAVRAADDLQLELSVDDGNGGTWQVNVDVTVLAADLGLAMTVDSPVPNEGQQVVFTTIKGVINIVTHQVFSCWRIPG